MAKASGVPSGYTEKEYEKIIDYINTYIHSKRNSRYSIKVEDIQNIIGYKFILMPDLKERIQKGDTIGSFPKHYLKIFKAKFTDETDNDLFFKVKAKEYIKAQQLVYSDSKNVKEHFNAGVDACLKCHESKCGGPIQRIKKLYIKE